MGSKVRAKINLKTVKIVSFKKINNYRDLSGRKIIHKTCFNSTVTTRRSQET